MTEINYSEFITPYEEVEESHGLVNTPMKKGKYLLKIAKIQGKDTTQDGVPRVRMQLRAINPETREPFGSPAFIDMYLGAGPYKRVNGEKVLRTPEEKQKSINGAIGRARGLMSSIGVPKGVGSNDLDGVFSFYNVDQWEGREFVGEISVDAQDRNDLRNFFPLDDPKKGLASLRKGAAAAAPVGTL